MEQQLQIGTTQLLAPMVRLNFDPNVTGPTNIEDNSYSKFNVYPNPNNGILNISLSNSSENQTIEIKNIIGQMFIRKLLVIHRLLLSTYLILIKAFILFL